ncbi:hypothetical protein GIB67_037134 [Kingdonia uniflora]|uniref:RNase H type-1 domain-containing protein n=1 Tax=Kingdonia uniflora TaxID=39325 RepID=A0A7J7LHU0_9MAGN|nr:hypothetical protein GIB67_037134 [Kingdonia uniflora]
MYPLRRNHQRKGKAKVFRNGQRNGGGEFGKECKAEKGKGKVFPESPRAQQTNVIQCKGHRALGEDDTEDTGKDMIEAGQEEEALAKAASMATLCAKGLYKARRRMHKAMYQEFIEDLGYDPETLRCFPVTHDPVAKDFLQTEGIEADFVEKGIRGGVETPVIEGTAFGITTNVVVDGAWSKSSFGGVGTEEPAKGEGGSETKGLMIGQRYGMHGMEPVAPNVFRFLIDDKKAGLKCDYASGNWKADSINNNIFWRKSTSAGLPVSISIVWRTRCSTCIMMTKASEWGKPTCDVSQLMKEMPLGRGQWLDLGRRAASFSCGQSTSDADVEFVLEACSESRLRLQIIFGSFVYGLSGLRDIRVGVEKWPASVIKVCKGNLWNFLWSGESDTKIACVVAWDKVCKPCVRGAIEDVISHSGWVIGDGTCSDLWRDIWCSPISLRDMINNDNIPWKDLHAKQYGGSYNLIWKARNNNFFENQITTLALEKRKWSKLIQDTVLLSPGIIFNCQSDLSILHSLHIPLHPGRSTAVKSCFWERPEKDEVKINTDGAARGNSAECKAIIHGIESAASYGWLIAWVESDSKATMEAFN